MLTLWLDLAMASAPDVNLTLEQGWLALERGDLAQARAHAREVLVDDPDRASALALYRAAMERAGLGPQAVLEVGRTTGVEPWKTIDLSNHLAAHDWKAARADIAAAPSPWALEPLWESTDAAVLKLRDRTLAQQVAPQALAQSDVGSLLALRRLLAERSLPGGEAVHAALVARGVELPPPALTQVDRSLLARSFATDPTLQLPVARASDLVAIVEQVEATLAHAHQGERLARMWGQIEQRDDLPIAYAREAESWLAAGQVYRASDAARRAVREAASPQDGDPALLDTPRLRRDLARALLARARVAASKGEISVALGDYGAAVALAGAVLDDKLAERLQLEGLPQARALQQRFGTATPTEIVATADPNSLALAARAADARFLLAWGTGSGASIAHAPELYGSVFGRTFALDAAAREANGDLEGARADAVIATLLADRPPDWATRARLHRSLGENDAAFYAYLAARADGIRELDDALLETYSGVGAWNVVADALGPASEEPYVEVAPRPRPTAARRPPTAPRLGQIFPTFHLDTDRGTFGSANLRGRTTVLVFFDGTCPDCPALAASFGSVARRLRAAGKSVSAIGIGMHAERADFEPVASAHAEKVELMWAPHLRTSLVITDVPTIWVIDATGTAQFLFDYAVSPAELETTLAKID